MKLLPKLPIMAILAVMLFSCTTDNIDTLDDKVDAMEQTLITPETKTIEIEILEHINNYRLSIGLNPLKEMEVIKSVAYSHTDYMVDNDEVSHNNFFARSSYLKEKVGAKEVSENVAYGYSTGRTVVNAWLKSEGHKATIEGDFTNCDVSAEMNEAGRWYFTNIFIKK